MNAKSLDWNTISDNMICNWIVLTLLNPLVD